MLDRSLVGVLRGSRWVRHTGVDNRLDEDDTYTYDYNGEGQLTKRTSRLSQSLDANDVFRWDPAGRLISVTQNDSSNAVIQTIQYGYDANGLLIGRRVVGADGTTETSKTGFVRQGLQVLAELDLMAVDPVITELYLHGTEPNEIVVTDMLGSGNYHTVWGFTDALGSLSTVASKDLGDWKVVHGLTSEYGGNRQQVGDTSVPHLMSSSIWAGHHVDEDTGLTEAKARWYDSSSGRFISQDPSGFAAGDANLYRYVGNGPTNATDPSGLEEYEGPAIGQDPNPTPWWHLPFLGNEEDTTVLYNPGFVESVVSRAYHRLTGPFTTSAMGVRDAIATIGVFARPVNSFDPLNSSIANNVARLKESERIVQGLLQFPDNWEHMTQQERINVLSAAALTRGAAGYAPGAVSRFSVRINAGKLDAAAVDATITRSIANNAPSSGLIHGTGNAPGIFEIGVRAKLTAVVRQQLSNGRLREFVYLPEEGIFAINKHLDYRRTGPRFPGSDGSAHSTIRSSLPRSNSVVGGNIRYRNGRYVTDELSNHYGRNWTDEIREKFRKFTREQGFEVDHNVYSGG